MLGRGSNLSAEVILEAVERLCTLCPLQVLGSDRALSSTVWQNAQSQAAWQSQSHGLLWLRQHPLSSHPRHLRQPM
ncbi:hypothetical protein IWW50_005815, partial [Coemansia erecta]